MERLKRVVVAVLPFPGETLLVLAGLGSYLLTCAVLRRPLSWGWAILPGVALAVLIEGWEIWDHWSAPGADPRGQALGILGRHAGDVLLMNLPAVMVWAAAAWLERGGGR